MRLMDPSVPPTLQIDSGTHFGYHGGPFWNRREQRLVEVGTTVVIGPGLHLFVAPNGAGKTTLMRTLAGLNRILAGGLHVQGSVLYLSDELKMDAELRAETLFRAMFKGPALERARQLSDTLKLSLSTPIGHLSRGNRQKVLLIMAETRLHASRGSVVLMDEPLSGLDAETRETVAGLWAEPKGRALRLVVLHELESMRHADSLFTIKSGTLRHAPERAGGSWVETYQALQK
ncbi:MAG: ATP-binding cassette domain-containing protein [Verrucomicrobiaceae bacterium]|nr:MAG: ATP-binding cassette domain-containing protein [Verrucomicrobiaceae bacterium]